MADTGKKSNDPRKITDSKGAHPAGAKKPAVRPEAVAAGSSAQAFHNNATSKELFTVALYIGSIQIPEAEPKSKRGNVQL
jgi:hypothetical protein